LTSFTALGQPYLRAELPPLLEFLDGRKVKSHGEWEERREEIRSLLIKYFIGSFPGEIPQITGAKVTSENVHDEIFDEQRSDFLAALFPLTVGFNFATIEKLKQRRQLSA
jgi:hypothetical protein